MPKFLRLPLSWGQKSYLGIKYQITLATFLPLIIFGLSSLAIGTYTLSHILEDLILQRQTALAQVAAAGVAGNLSGYTRLLETTASELSDYSGTPAHQQQILIDRANILSIFSGGVTLLDNSGTAIAATPGAETEIGLSYGFRPYFREARANLAPVFSTVFQEYPSGQNTVVIAVPVHQGLKFLGVVMGTLPLTERAWAQDLSLLRTSQGGRAYLVDNASTIIYHPDIARLGTSIQTDYTLWRLVLVGQSQGMIYQPPGSGQFMVVSFAPIPGVAWGLIIEEPWQAILAAIVPYEWVAGGILMLGMLLALVALLLSINRITQPLNALVSEVQQVADGQPFKPLPLQGPPDLQTLLNVVNQMVVRLGEQQTALRQYAQQILHSQEEERLRLSHDLHDETVQDLIALIQRIELCYDALELDPVAARQRLDEVEQLAQNTLVEVRRMSNNLRPFILEDLGLASALQLLARELHRQLPQARVHCEIVGREERLATEAELTVFRIAQEALNNIRKHAATATQVNMALFYEDWGVMLMVEDNGSGFTSANSHTLVREGHLGLAGMAERAQLFGGHLDITSEPGAGTTVSLRLPRQESRRQIEKFGEFVF